MVKRTRAGCAAPQVCIKFSQGADIQVAKACIHCDSLASSSTESAQVLRKPRLTAGRDCFWFCLQALEEEEEEARPKTPKQDIVVSGGLVGFGVAQDLLKLDFSPEEVAPPEYRAVPYNAALPQRLRSGASGESVYQECSCLCAHQDLLKLGSSPEEVAPLEYRAVPYNTTLPQLLRSGAR